MNKKRLVLFLIVMLLVLVSFVSAGTYIHKGNVFACLNATSTGYDDVGDQDLDLTASGNPAYLSSSPYADGAGYYFDGSDDYFFRSNAINLTKEEVCILTTFMSNKTVNNGRLYDFYPDENPDKMFMVWFHTPGVRLYATGDYGSGDIFTLPAYTKEYYITGKNSSDNYHFWRDNTRVFSGSCADAYTDNYLSRISFSKPGYYIQGIMSQTIVIMNVSCNQDIVDEYIDDKETCDEILAIPEDNPPTVTSPTFNTTYYAKNDGIKWNCTASDAGGLSFGWCSWNDSGTWQNFSYIPLTGTDDSWDCEKTVTSSRDTTINVMCYVNDTSGKMGYNESSFIVENSPPEIDSLKPEDDYHNRGNLTVNFTYKDLDGDNGDCSLYINGSLNKTQNDIAHDTLVIFSANMGDEGHYSWHVSCTDNINVTGSEERLFVIDLTNPIITWTYPSEDNTTISNEDLSLDVSCFDENLYQLLVNVTDSSDNSIRTNLSTATTETTLTASDYIPLQYEDNYTVKITCSDKHTAAAIDDYVVDKVVLEDKLMYDTGNNDISISLKTSDISLNDFSTAKLKDRYKFTYDFSSVAEDDTLRTFVFVLEAEHPLIYLEDSAYKAHFISNRNWIDFNFDDENAEYAVTRISDYQYEISITTTKTLLDFNSIGGLNIVEEHALYQYEITLPYYTNLATNASDSTKTGENVHFNVTWFDDHPSHYVFCYGAGSCVNETSGTYTSGELITIEKQVSEVHNDVVYWQFFANDTAGNWDQTDLSSFTIANTIPEITPPSINNTSPNTDDILECNNGSFIDADGESAIWYYKWFDNDVLISGQTSLTLDLSIEGLDRGNVIKCEITGSDGTDNSTPLNSSPVTIQNYLPTHSQPLLSSTLGTNYTNENLTCYNQSTYDGDGDLVVNIYNWFGDNNALNALYLPFEINVDDYSGSGNDGTKYGGNFVSGKIGNGLEFDGSEYVSIADNDALDFADEKTWELWFKRASTGLETIFDKTNSDQNLTNYKLYFDNNNYLVFTYSIPGTEAGDFSWVTSAEADFNQGSYSDTYYNTNAVELLAGKSSGKYNSTIFDAGALSSWNNISWAEEIPYGEELPDDKGSDIGADMSGNVLLLHMNNNWNDSSNGNNGNAYNGATFTTLSKFGSHAGSFDGADDYVKGSDAGWPSGSEPITMAAWIKTTDNYGHIIVHGTWTNNQAIYLYIDNGKMVIGKWGGEHVGTFTVNDGKWHYVTGIWNGSKALVYVDGDLKNTGNFTGLNVVLNEYHITTSGWPLNGIIDEVAVWNRTLSADEIMNLYKRGILKLNLTLRSCDDASCAGESFDLTCTDTPCDISSLTDSQYLQYKALFETNNTDYSPKLYNVTVGYTRYSAGVEETSLSSTSQITDTGWHYTAVTFDNDTAVDNFKMYIDDSLDNYKTEHTTSQYKDNDLYIGKNYQSTSYFDGVLDEFRIYDFALTPEQILNNYNLNYNKIIYTETIRSETYICSITPTDGEGDGITKNSTILTIKNYIPEPAPTLLNPEDGYVTGALPEFNWTESYDTVDYDAVYYIIQIDNNSDFSSLDYTNTLSTNKDTSVTLDSTKIDTYYWRVLATDNIGNSSWSSPLRQFTYAQWNITFNVTSGEDGSFLNNIDISCNYTGFNQAGDTTNPYGPYVFPPGDWKCTFDDPYDDYYTKTITFNANDNKIVNVILAWWGYLSIEEHTWLEALYNCIILKDCDLYNLLIQINQTIGNVWEHTKPTDPSVVTTENEISTVANSTHNITYDYTINIPNKAGYAVNTYLPIRIGYWFINKDTGQCYSQGNPPSGIELIEPYCQPLMIETIGPMGGSVSFRVDLRPSNLTAGTYNITRSVDIDPNNIWNNYGQESIGEIIVTEDLTGSGGISTETTAVDEVETVVVETSPSGGGGGGGGGGSVTNIINIYNITNIIQEGEEEGKEKEMPSQEETESQDSLAGITGAAVTDLSKASPLVGIVIIIVIVIAGLISYFFYKKKE